METFLCILTNLVNVDPLTPCHTYLVKYRKSKIRFVFLVDKFLDYVYYYYFYFTIEKYTITSYFRFYMIFLKIHVCIYPS